MVRLAAAALHTVAGSARSRARRLHCYRPPTTTAPRTPRIPPPPPPPGRDLYNALDVPAAGGRERLFGWRRRGRKVALDVAKALNYLHSKGIVHLDM